MKITNLILEGTAVLGLSAVLSLPAYAAPVAPEQAMQEALEFLSSNSGTAFRAPASLPIAYTASSEETALYYVFNYDNGFVITSADDRLPAILGYSDNGNFDFSRIPDNFKWWLSEYSREISEFLPTAPQSGGVLRQRKDAPRQPIAPMTKTTWDQSAPYNDDCPTVNGQRAVTGCVATAVSQIMKFHNWPEKPVGSNAGVTFSGTTFDWANMLDSYERGKYSSTQGAAVAKLMRQVGAGVNMQYSPYASGAYDYDVQLALTKYFGYDPSLTFYWKDYTPMKEWVNLVYNELAEGRPVYYSGSSSEGGHAFVCDGYSENDYFHFNWGWGGYEDGYFLLSALNPASGGAGSYEGGYNRGQCIITGIKPASKVTPQNPAQSAFISTGAFYYNAKEEMFEIRGGSQGISLMYNPLGYSQTLQFGLEVVNAGSDEVVDYVDLGENTVEPFYGFAAFTVDDMQVLPDGSYRLYIVYRKKAGEWKRVGIPLGMQNYVALSVQNGKCTYSNNGPDSDFLPHLILDEPMLPGKVYANTDIAFHLPILNVGDGDFSGEIGVTLIDKNNEFGDIGSFTEIISVPGKSFFNLPVTITSGVGPGIYNVSIMDATGTEYAENLTLEVIDGNLPTPSQNDIVVSDLSVNFYTADTETSLYYSVWNDSSTPVAATLSFELWDGNSLKKIKSLSIRQNITAPAHSSLRFNTTPAKLDIDPGYYLYRAVDASGKALSNLYPLIVESQVRQTASGLSYIITGSAEKTAIVTAPESGPYTGFTYVPNTLGSYIVTGIRADAFAFFEGQTVNIDGNITRIPNGGFYCAKQLSNLTLTGNALVEPMALSFNPEYSRNCWLNVKENTLEQYRQNEVWKNFKMPCWHFNLTDTSIASTLPEGYFDPETSILYLPTDVPFALQLSSNVGKNIRYLMTLNGNDMAGGVIAPVGETIDVPALGTRGIGRITATATDDPVAVTEVSDDAATDTNVYSLDGALILLNATEEELYSLPAGIYIYGNEKILVP